MGISIFAFITSLIAVIVAGAMMYGKKANLVMIFWFAILGMCLGVNTLILILKISILGL